MKKAIVFAAIMLFQFVSAQDLTKTIGAFKTIKAFDQIDVLLVKGSENKVIIKGSRKEDVEVVTKNDELKIRMKLSKLLKGEDISVTVYYTDAINQAEASEGSRIASQDNFKATAFTLNAKEGAEIKLNIETKKLNTKASSGGILNVSGSADNNDIVINSGGIFHGKDFITKQTVISVNAGGEADVHATELVEAKTRAGGDINIYGNPPQINKKTFAGGSINTIK